MSSAPLCVLCVKFFALDKLKSSLPSSRFISDGCGPLLPFAPIGECLECALHGHLSEVFRGQLPGSQDEPQPICGVAYPPKVAISKLVNSLKGVSSRRLKQEFPDLARRYCRGALWSPSYFAASLWWCSHHHHPAVHRATADAGMSTTARRAGSRLISRA